MFENIFIIFNYVHSCVSVCLCIHMHSGVCTWAQVPVEARGSPGAGVTVICKVPGMGAKNQTQVTWKSIKCS